VVSQRQYTIRNATRACVYYAGNDAIYSVHGKFTETAGEDTYCNPTLYWFAFWITTTGYIIVGVVIVTVIIACTRIKPPNLYAARVR